MFKKSINNGSRQPGIETRHKVLLFLLLPTLLYAEPQDDYHQGLEAYQREDLIASIEALRIAADSGHAKAQSLLGYIFDVAEENERALHYYRLAAEQGEADGAYGIGTLYATGQGVAQDHPEAVRWYEKAADAGHPLAIDALATAYLNGGLALARDSRKAIELLERGAALGHLSSVERLKSIRGKEGM
ncbi:MAG: tetratricopeptide repeat protein [Candidatus Thiodiazotropha sp.]